MGKVFAPSGTSARNQQIAQNIAQQAELDKQRGIAETQQVGALQDTLENETNRLARVFGTRALLAGTGTRAAVR